MAKIDALRKALESDDAVAVASATSGYPACNDAPPEALLTTQASARDVSCFAAIANALGSKKGFLPMPADHAATATIAVVLLRDGRGDWVAHAENWLGSLRNGKGSGPDTLRLAVARKMAAAAPVVGRTIETESGARDAMKAVAGAIPGACPTYWLLGSGTEAAAVATEHSADHAACVQHDLKRREGPGGSYGSGTFRALEGSLALWRETERALRLGVSSAGSSAKPTIEAKLAVIEPATHAIATKKMEATSPDAAVAFLGAMHADAGAPMERDAGSRPTAK